MLLFTKHAMEREDDNCALSPKTTLGPAEQPGTKQKPDPAPLEGCSYLPFDGREQINLAPANRTPTFKLRGNPCGEIHGFAQAWER